MLSDDVRSELAAIAPVRRCDGLAEISGALPHRRHAPSPGPRRGGAPSRSRLVGGRPAGVLPPPRARRRERDPHVPPARLRPGDALPAPRRRFGRRARRAAGGRDRRPQAARRSRARPGASSGVRCCRAAYVRGAFLGSGSVSGPRRPHLELRFADVEGAAFLADAAAQEDVVLRVRDRGRYGVAYARGAEPIADALALAGASDAALAIDEHAVIGAARASANRLANADHANLVRTARPRTRSFGLCARSSSAASSPRSRCSSRRWPRSACDIRRRRSESSVRNASPGREGDRPAAASAARGAGRR